MELEITETLKWRIAPLLLKKPALNLDHPDRRYFKPGFVYLTDGRSPSTAAPLQLTSLDQGSGKARFYLIGAGGTVESGSRHNSDCPHSASLQ
jgi:hypothetical protein